MSRWPVKTGTRGRRPRVDEGRGWSCVAVSQGTDVSQRRPKPEGAARPAPPGPRALARGSSPPGPGAGPRLAFCRRSVGPRSGPPGKPTRCPWVPPLSRRSSREHSSPRMPTRRLFPPPPPAACRPHGRTGHEGGWVARAPRGQGEARSRVFKETCRLVIFAAASARTRRARPGLIHQLPRPYANIIFLQYSEKSHTRHSLKAP